MYKVFVNDKPLFLTNEIQKETDFQLFLLDSVDIKQVIVKMFQNKIIKAYLYYPDEKEIMKKLKAKIPVNKAGGGLVYNKNGDVYSFLETENGICLRAESKKRSKLRIVPSAK